MNYLYLILMIIGLTLQNIAKKSYNEKVLGKGTYLFCGLTCFFALIFFVITSGGFEMDVSVLPYSLAFAMFYLIATVSSILAIMWGALSLTNLFISLSLIIPTFFGIFFLKDSVSIGFVLGFILLMISILLINSNRKSSAVISARWVIAVVLAFSGNGICNVIQKLFQIKFNRAYNSEFMVYALIIVVCIFMVMAFIKERDDVIISIKCGWLPALVCGIGNGIVNLFILILNGRMPVSLMYPLFWSGSIVTTYIAARLLYKEKLSKRETQGFIIGVMAIILLNI